MFERKPVISKMKFESDGIAAAIDYAPKPEHKILKYNVYESR